MKKIMTVMTAVLLLSGMTAYAGGGGKKKAKKAARKTECCEKKVCCKTGEPCNSVQLSSSTTSEGKADKAEKHCDMPKSCAKKD